MANKIMRNENIILIGPSGIGKTTVASYISRFYGFIHFDTDILIQDIANMTVSEIFNTYGEKYFRKLESKVVKEIFNKKRLVISTGGGIVLNNNNVKLLKQNGIIFLLDGKVETIIRNLRKSKEKRPLVGDDYNWVQNVKRMYLDRNMLYSSSAEYTINVDCKNVEEIGKEILYIYEKHLSCSN